MADTRFTQGMDGGMRIINHWDSNEGLSSEFPEVYQVQQKTPEEDRRVQRPKCCEYNNQDTNSSLQYLENNYSNASSLKQTKEALVLLKIFQCSDVKTIDSTELKTVSPFRNWTTRFPCSMAPASLAKLWI